MHGVILVHCWKSKSCWNQYMFQSFAVALKASKISLPPVTLVEWEPEILLCSDLPLLSLTTCSRREVSCCFLETCQLCIAHSLWLAACLLSPFLPIGEDIWNTIVTADALKRISLPHQIDHCCIMHSLEHFIWNIPRCYRRRLLQEGSLNSTPIISDFMWQDLRNCFRFYRNSKSVAKVFYSASNRLLNKIAPPPIPQALHHPIHKRVS